MNAYTLGSIILTLAIFIGYLNHRYIRMQTTIAIMSSSLIISLIIILLGHTGFHDIEYKIASVFKGIDFHNLLMNGMLSFLLFAGALHIDISDLKDQKWEIGILASVSTIFSAILVGLLTYYGFQYFNYPIPMIYCMLFGALISPTDPIAVLATFKQLGAPRALTVQVEGESLFNDGVGIVIFLTIYHLAISGAPITWHAVLTLFLQQAIGGISYGALLGYVALKLIQSSKDHKIQILITLMIVTGGYTLAQTIGISGPLAMVVAGIFIGNTGRKVVMSEKSRESLDTFWELIDEVLNAVLFLLIGFELLIVNTQHHHRIAAILAIPLVLFVRYVTVAIPMWLFKLKRRYAPHTIKILVWGGLRGGLAVALALSLPDNPYRVVILSMTYAVVMFSIIVQGLSIKSLVKKTSH